jgi:transposase-like protein
MNAKTLDALQLCRSLLAFTSPGTPVAVPHAALAQVVEMASGGAGKCDPPSDPESLEQLYDVAALARRYNRALPTVRQWFHDGLFGPPEERRFRGRGYVASADAVREFEIRTGLRAVVAELERERPEAGTPMVEVAPPVPVPPRVARSPRAATRTSGIGGKIFAEARGGRSRRVA